jgi:COMPASS component SWD3
MAVAWGPTGMVASAGFDESVRIWDGRDGRCLRAIPAHSDPVTGVSFGPDGSLLVSSSYDGLIRVWDTNSGRCLKTIVDDDNPSVSSVVFSFNGKYLLAATLDDTIRLWSLQTGKCVKSYSGHVNRKYCIAPNFVSIRTDDERSGGDMHVISGSEDGRVLIWNLNSRTIVLDEKIYEKPVIAVAAHPSRRLIATASMEPELSIKLFSF